MMKRFVVSYVNFFENQLQMKEFQAESEVAALYMAAKFFGIETGDFHATDAEDFEDWCFDCECLMKAYEVK